MKYWHLRNVPKEWQQIKGLIMGFYKKVFLTVLAVGLSACGNNQDVAEEASARVVQLATVMEKTSEETFSFPAKVIAKSTVDLAFRVGGRLEAVNLPQGQFIEKGAVIARLDQKPFKRALRTAQVRLKQAQHELSRVQAIADKGIGSEKAVDNAQVDYDLAQIELENAKANLEYSELRAPFRALVAKRLIENEGFIQQGTAIARLQDLSRVHFEFDVPERLISAYRKNSMVSARAFMDGIVNDDFDIEYVEHSTEPNPVTQTYQVVFAMDFPEGAAITPGIRATISITAIDSQTGQANIVPVSAVVTGSNDGLYVWLFNEETQTVTKQPITGGKLAQGWLPVFTGLEAGQKVVAAGASQMKEGMKVRPFVMQ